MENRSLSYSPALDHWRVKKWTRNDARKFLYNGDSFQVVLDFLLGSNKPGTQGEIDQ